jgi:hypothetical protein
MHKSVLLQTPGVGVAVVAGVGGLAASSAQADTIVTQTVSVNQLLSAGGAAFSNVFSIGSLLASQNLTGEQIVSATITAYGYSDPTVNQSTSSTVQYATYSYAAYNLQYTYSYGCGWGGTCYATAYNGYGLYRGYENLTTVTQTDNIQDQMQLVAGAASTGAGVVGQAYSSSYANNGASYASNGTLGYDTYTYVTQTNTVGYYGALSATANAVDSDLATLNATDQLAFSVDAANGAFNLSQVTLSVDVEPVPLPAPVLLLSGGLGIVAAAARRRRAKRLAPTLQ